MTEEEATGVNEQGNEDEGIIHANYLLSATNYLKGIPSNALRSHWNILLSDVMHMKRLALPERQKKYPTCQYCRTPWRNGHYSVRVIPKRKMKKKLRKIVRKVEQKRELSTFQKSLANVIHTGPTVVLNCKICHKTSKIKVPQDKQIISIIEETAQMKEMKVSKKNKKKLQKKNRKKEKKREKKAAGSDPVRAAQSNDTKENSNSVQEENKINNNNNDDNNDIIIIDEKPVVNQRSGKNSKKRKLDDDDDDVIPILNHEPEKSKKVMKDGVNLLRKTSFGVQSKQSPQCNAKKNNSILLDNWNSPSKRNTLSKIVPTNKLKQNKRNKKNCFQKKQQGMKKNLTRWKKLIADEEAEASKTTSLHDFLSIL